MHHRRSALFIIAAIAIFVLRVGDVRAQTDTPDLGGHLEAEVNGQTIALPMLHSDFQVSVEGDLTSVTVVQTFENPTQSPINATYLFPLNEEAAVDAMTMQVGDEIIRAQIRQKEEARVEYERARQEGRSAALLTQHRPNMFTQEVANLMPGAPVRITLHYSQAVPRVDGAYELVLPIVVGPRYNPRPPGDNVAVSAPGNGQWSIAPPPAYPHEVFGLTLPNTIPPDRVSIGVNLHAAFPIAEVASGTHALAVGGDAEHRTVSLQAGHVIDNRDFVLRYSLAGGAVQAGVLSHVDARGGYFSLVVEPPANPDPSQITAREIVFVLDTSGSMSGEPIEASKAFMQEALNTLRPNDYFRIVQFDATPREYTAGPVPASPDRIAAAHAFISGLTAQGGTELAPAVDQAFGVRQQPNTLRIVVFLSDGYIGNEADVLCELSRVMGSARVYAFGVGSSTNRYLLSEMARRGHGIARYIDPTETSLEAARALAHRIEAPVLTDISIDWGNLHPTDVTPAILPDLFAGDSLRVMGRFANVRDAIVTVHGKVNGREATLPVHVNLTPQTGDQASAIPVIWARSQISDLMRDFTSPEELRTVHATNNELQDRVTRLGLDYAVVTNWTSFVAVSQRVVNHDVNATRDANVPLPMPAGVGPNAYGDISAPQSTGGGTFFGAPAPEPSEYSLLALLLALASYLAWRRYNASRERVSG